MIHQLRTFIRYNHVAYLLRYLREYRRFKRLCRQTGETTRIKPYPITIDYNGEAGHYDAHYFHQDLWAAQKIFQAAPETHVDIGSRLDGFISHLLVFHTDVVMLDVRPISKPIEHLRFIQTDGTTLSDIEDASIQSISTLHAAEHFGLGRYNDPLDPQGTQRFCHALQRVLKPGGRLYFSVPCGAEDVIYFNGHRVFKPHTILGYFSELSLRSFSCVLDDNNFYANTDPARCHDQRFACGLFEFEKPVSQ